jgi:hypothetical protein
MRQRGGRIVSRPDGHSVRDHRRDSSDCSAVPLQLDVDNLAAGGANTTALLVQHALRAGALQRVNNTMVGFQVDDVIGNAKRE